MSRLFGALANAYGQYEGGRFKRKQYDDSQAQQALENQRRAFEFAATNGRLEEQMRLMQQQREDALQRQREMDVIGAQQNGYETAAPEAVASAANAFMQSQGMGGPGGVVRAPTTPVAQYDAEGIPFGDKAQKPRDVQYASVGGRLMRYDPQREVNDKTLQAFQKYMGDLKIKRDVAQENQAARDAAARDRAIELEQMRQEGRMNVESLKGALRQSGQQEKPQPRPTEAQEKSYLYYKLMKDGNAVMQQFGDKVDPNKIGAYLTSKFFKPALTPEEQQFMQGARSFTAGVNRKESGAAIRDSEVAEAMARYIDMPLDAPATRALKRKQREQYEQTLQHLAKPARLYYGDYDQEPGAPAITGKKETTDERVRRLLGQKP